MAWSQVPVSIGSTPTGAVVTIDGASAGTTPLEDYALAPGPHTIRVTLEGWAPAEKQIQIQEARSGQIHFRLQPLLKIEFNTKERGLTYIFDNRYTWKKKKVLFYVEKGKHVLQVKRAEEVVEERIFNFTRNQKLNFSLQEKED
jgi:hypothetical protein